MIFDVEISEGNRIFYFEDDAIWSLRFSPNGKCIATGCGHKTVKIRSTKWEVSIVIFNSHGNVVNPISRVLQKIPCKWKARYYCKKMEGEFRRMSKNKQRRDKGKISGMFLV